MYKVGDKVEKYSGDAQYKGVVVSVYETLKGHTRFVVEVLPQHFQMIVSEKQIRHDND